MIRTQAELDRAAAKIIHDNARMALVELIGPRRDLNAPVRRAPLETLRKIAMQAKRNSRPL